MVKIKFEEQLLGIITRSHTSTTEIAAIKLTDGLPRADGSSKEYKYPNEVFRILRGWLDKMNNYAFNRAMLGTLITCRSDIKNAGLRGEDERSRTNVLPQIIIIDVLGSNHVR